MGHSYCLSSYAVPHYDLVGPVDITDLMEAAVLKDVNLSHIPSRYSPALRAIQKDALKVTVLKSDLGFEAVLLGLPDVTKSAECLYGHHCHSL